MDKFAIAVNMARYVDGGADQCATGDLQSDKQRCQQVFLFHACEGSLASWCSLIRNRGHLVGPLMVERSEKEFGIPVGACEYTE